MRAFAVAAALSLVLAAAPTFAQAPAPAAPPAPQAAPAEAPFPTGAKYAFVNIQRVAAESGLGADHFRCQPGHQFLTNRGRS